MDTTNRATLLGDSVDVRASLSRLHAHITKGPLPLKAACFLVCAVALGVDTFLSLSNLVTVHWFELIVTIDAAIFALIGMMLEAHQNPYAKRCQRWMNTWVKMLGRVWGRGIFYVVASGIHMRLAGTLGFVLGLLFLACGVASLAVSRVAAGKLQVLHERVVAGHTDDIVYIRQVFNRYDKDATGFLSVPELAAAARELGSEFTAQELVAIFEYMDADADGKIAFEEFERWFIGGTDVAYSRIPLPFV